MDTKTKADRREVTNPHDKITIDYTDKDAARAAVLWVGEGAYGIEGEDGMPLLIFGAAETWIRDQYDKTIAEFFDTVSKERLIVALKSMRLSHRRSSMSDPVGNAHRMAKALLKSVSV